MANRYTVTIERDSFKVTTTSDGPGGLGFALAEALNADDFATIVSLAIATTSYNGPEAFGQKEKAFRDAARSFAKDMRDRHERHKCIFNEVFHNGPTDTAVFNVCC